MNDTWIITKIYNDEKKKYKNPRMNVFLWALLFSKKDLHNKKKNR
jgi:hypothetical protein